MGIAAQVEDQDGQQRKDHDGAEDQHARVQARRGRSGGSRRGGHQRNPSAAAEAAGMRSGAVTVATRRGGTSATSPPSAINAVAIQIHPTLGLTRTSRPTVPAPASMLWIERYRSPVKLVRTAGVPMGSSWLSY